jgi:hypothetical protein
MCLSQHWQEIRVKSACELIDSFWCSIWWWGRILPKVTYSCRAGTPYGISTYKISVRHECITWGKIRSHHRIARQKLPISSHTNIGHILLPYCVRHKIQLLHIQQKPENALLNLAQQWCKIRLRSACKPVGSFWRTIQRCNRILPQVI